MKKPIALILVLMMVLSLAACGSKTEPEAEPAAPAAQPETEPAAQPEGGEATAADWNDFADIFTLTFYGVTTGGETVAFVLTGDESFAALAVANTETMESVSFVGAMVPVTFEDGATGYTITDEATGNTLSFAAEFFDDGSVSLDLGDYGAMVITACEQSEAFALLNAIEAETIAVA